MAPSLTSAPDRFSDDAWELLLTSQDQARRWRHGAMDVEHVLQSLLLESRFDRWSDALGLDRDGALDQIEAFCADQPSSDSDALYIGDALEDLLEQADAYRSRQGAPLLEVNHLIEALPSEPRIGAALLAARNPATAAEPARSAPAPEIGRASCRERV